MLLIVPEHSQRDLDVWAEREREDAAWPHERVDRLVEESLGVLRSTPLDYVSVSWGKDSVVLAHLAWRAGVTAPLCWVNYAKFANPHCVLVRDAYLRIWVSTYHEEIAASGGRWCDADYDVAFDRVAARFGSRRASGIRADESSSRRMRALRGATWGTSTAPLLRWTSRDIFAYAHREGLPLHPVYAMSMGGSLDRGSLRTDAVGGKTGLGFGRAEWERRYYPEIWHAAQ